MAAVNTRSGFLRPNDPSAFTCPLATLVYWSNPRCIVTRQRPLTMRNGNYNDKSKIMTSFLWLPLSALAGALVLAHSLAPLYFSFPPLPPPPLPQQVHRPRRPTMHASSGPSHRAAMSVSVAVAVSMALLACSTSRCPSPSSSSSRASALHPGQPPQQLRVTSIDRLSVAARLELGRDSDDQVRDAHVERGHARGRRKDEVQERRG